MEVVFTITQSGAQVGPSLWKYVLTLQPSGANSNQGQLIIFTTTPNTSYAYGSNVTVNVSATGTPNAS